MISLSKAFLVFFLLILFLGTRLAHILTADSVITDPEECLSGAIGYDLVLGPRASLWHYQLDEYSGGTVLAGLLASLFFSWLGPTLFALKMVPLVFSFSVLLLVLWILKRYFNFTSAIWAGLLILFAPPAYIISSHYAMGSHPESVLFTILQIGLTFELLRNPARKILVGVGLVSGLGLWFAYLTVLGTGTCLLMLLSESKTRRFLSGHGLWGIGAFAVGLLPWILFNFTSEWEGLTFIVQSFRRIFFSNGDSPSQTFYRFAMLWIDDLPQGFGLGSRVFNTAYFIGLLAVLAHNFKYSGRTRISLPLFFAFYAALFTGVYVFSGMPALAKYFSPFYFVMLLAASTAHRFTWLSYSLRIFLLGLGLLGHSRLLLQSTPGDALRLKGYCPMEYYGPFEKSLLPKVIPSPEVFSLIDRFMEERRPYSFQAMMDQAVFQLNVRPAQLENLLPMIPERCRPLFFESLGRHWAKSGPASTAKLREWEKIIPNPYQDFFYRGFTFIISSVGDNFFIELKPIGQRPARYRDWLEFHLGVLAVIKPDNAHFVRIEKMLEEEGVTRRMPWFFRGLGYQLAFSWHDNQIADYQTALNLIPFTIPENRKPDFFWGIGYGIREAFQIDDLRVAKFLERLPAFARKQAESGVADYP